MEEPRRPIPLQYETPPRAPSTAWQHVATVCLVIYWPAGLIALLSIVFANVETVLGTGPMILTIGVLLMVSGWMIGYVWAILLGAGHAAVSLLFFTLVQVYSWGPQDAVAPFTAMGTTYVVVSAVPGLLAWQRRPKPGRGG